MGLTRKSPFEEAGLPPGSLMTMLATQNLDR
jgi:hypothetical protein